MRRILQICLLRSLFFAAALLTGTALVHAQTPQTQGNSITGETPEQFAARTKWWREARFGMFIHWGLYAVPADSSKGLAEWYMNNFQMQVKDYEKFAPQFNPAHFDAKQWVKMAKEAGMKYIVITTKHHDGFDMFDAHNSDYTIVKSTPFHHDPMKDLAEECRRQGIKLCFYHSIMDWHHPDYLPRRPWEKETRPADGAEYDRYRTYLKEQLRELITTYKPAVIWFDGEWEDTWTHAMGLDLYRYVGSLDPKIMVNNRVDKGRSGMAGINVSDAFAGDFGTPEQEVPPQGFADDRLWETCMTMNDTWGYARNDHHFKSAEQLIHTLCDVAHKGGNYLLNVGPTDLGEFPPESVKLLATMGAWMQKNHDAIYGTSKSPFKKLPFDGRCTQKGDRLYLHVFRWPDNGLVLEGLKTPLSSARVLATGEKLAISGTTSAGAGAVQIARPKTLDPYATVIELRATGPIVVEPITTTQKPVNGVFALQARDAETHGSKIQYEEGGGKDNIGYWTEADDYVTWTLEAPSAGDYSVALRYACETGSEGSDIKIGVENGAAVEAKVQATGDWAKFIDAEIPSGTLHLAQGKQELSVRVLRKPGFAVMNLMSVRLTPAAR